MSNKFKYTSFLIACVVAMLQLHAQPEFNVLDTNTFGFSQVVTIGNNYYATGQGFNTSGSGSITLYKINSGGFVQHIDTISADGIANINCQLDQFQNKLAIFNLTNSVYPFNGTTSDLQFSIYDTTFLEEFSFVFGGNQEELAFDLINVDSTFFVLGSSMSYGNSSGDILLSSINCTGGVNWTEIYGGAEAEYSRSLTATRDNKLLLLNLKEFVSPNWNLYLIKVDPQNGNKIWEKEYGGPFNDYSGEITALYDHSYLVYHNIDNGSNTTGYIDKLDGNGNVVWSRGFPYNDLSSFNYGRAIENPDGTLLVNCSVKNSFGSMISRLIKLSPLGDVIWTREYFTNQNMPQYFYDMKSTDDGGYVFSGSARNSDLNQCAWLVKTNCNGEDGTQYPISGTPCEQYDCSLYPIDGSFTTSSTVVDLAINGEVNFENNSPNVTSRVWNYGDGIMDYSDSLLSHTFTQVGSYQVQLIVFHGMCSDTMIQTIEVINSAGILSPNLDFGLELFPNPSNGEINISFDLAPEGKMELVDMTGRILKSCQLNGYQTSFKLGVESKGIYSLVIHHLNGRNQTQHVIIE